MAKERSIKVGPGIAVSYGAWGKEVLNKDLQKLCLTNKEWQLIGATRFTARHHPFEPTPFLPNREVIGRTMIEAGVGLAKEALQVNGWERADFLYAATSAPPDEDGKWAEKIAEQIGAQGVRINLLACNGGGEAFLNALKNPQLTDKRVVIVATDPLGYLADPKDPALMAIFGTGASVLAFRPNSIRLFSGKTVVEKDQTGVIRSPKTYQLPPAEERIKPPDWYEVKEGAEEVFAYSDRGAYMVLPEAAEGNPFMEMDGEATAFYFRDRVVGVQEQVLTEYYANNKKPIGAYICHQPSGVLTRHICRQLWKRLKSKNFPLVDRDNGVPWIMDGVGMGNASSATSLIAFAELASGLELGQNFLFASYGAGGSISAWTGQITE